MLATSLDRIEVATQSQADFSQMLMTPPSRVSSFSQVLDASLHAGQSSEFGIEAGFDADSFAWRHHEAQAHGELEYVRLGTGVWLVHGELQVNGTEFTWLREDRAVTFSTLLRGAAMIGSPLAPHRRVVYTDGCAVATSCSSDTLICRHALPGVRCQTVSVWFAGDDAMREFGLDPVEARNWIATAEPSLARSDRTLRIAVSTPSLPATRAAQAILWTPFTGSRRRLYLRSKAGELICHLLAGSALAPAGVAMADGGLRQDDDSLAAVVHAAMSDPDDCPDIADLAVRLQVSTGRLISAFKARYGKSPRDHAIATRMARARRLLQQTRTSLLDVALACGYEHHSSFSTAYRRAFGETPLETRRASAVY